MKAVSRVLAVTLFTVCISTQATAATLSFTINEKGTGDPLEGATIVLKQSGDYDTTDANGKLTFEDIELPQDIKILNSGYETLEQKVTETQITIYLDPLSFEGESLEVVADRVKEKVSKIVLNQQELRRVPGTSGDPIKAIETLPGVVTGGGGGGGGGPGAIYIRGSSGGENSVWVNQMPIDYLYHTWGLSVVNPGLVKDFNIFLGGYPVEYDDVLGGVIDIQLRDPKTDRLHQNYRVALNESAGLIEGPISENQSLYLAARASYIDKVLDPFLDDIQRLFSDPDSDTEVSVLTLPRYWDAQANWHYNMPGGTADLYYFGSGDALSFDINQLDTSDPQLLGLLDIDFGFHSVGTKIRQTLGPKVTAQFSASVKRLFEHQTLGQDENGDPFGVDGEYTTSLAHPQLIWTPSKNHELTLGSHGYYGIFPIKLYVPSLPTEENFQGSSFSSLDKFKVEETIRAASASPYLKWRWQIMKGLTAITGMRSSYVRATGGVSMFDHSPRASIEYQANEKLLLTASWGQFIQTPQEPQLLVGYGNPGLNFTKSEHRIVGAQYQATENWSVQLETYHKPMHDLVLTFDQPPPDIYQNAGEGEAYGIDLLIKRKYANRKMGWLSYSYAKSSRTTIAGQKRDFSGDQPHTINLVWSQPFSGSWNKWTWGIKLQAHSGRPYTPVVGRTAKCVSTGGIIDCTDQTTAQDDPALLYWDPVYDSQRNSKRFPFFHQLDARIDRMIRYNTWKMNIYLDLQNVTMTQNILSYDYGKNYENFDKPRKTGFPPIILPFFGIEAIF